MDNDFTTECFVCKSEKSRSEMVEIFSPENQTVMSCPSHRGVAKLHMEWAEICGSVLTEAALEAFEGGFGAFEEEFQEPVESE